jgi:hypothetical protein
MGIEVTPDACILVPDGLRVWLADVHLKMSPSTAAVSQLN